MKTVKELKAELDKFEDSDLCYAYEGVEVVGVIIHRKNGIGTSGVIHCSESEEDRDRPTELIQLRDSDIHKLRKKLEGHLDYYEAERIRNFIKDHSLRNYKPKYSPSAYISFMNGNECTFDKVNPQDTNYLQVWQMFSETSQHVYGDCVEECLDIAIGSCATKP